MSERSNTPRRLLNYMEAEVDQGLREACDRNSARVFAKVRVADVLPIQGSGISDASFSFALRSHFDFVVADASHLPLFAVEYDGISHGDVAQQLRDASKDDLCEHFKFPVLRVSANHVKRTYREMNLLTWFVEMWFMQVAIEDAEAQGLLPPEEGADPLFFCHLPGFRRSFPLMLAMDASTGLRRLRKTGKTISETPIILIGHGPQGSAKGIGLFGIAEDQWAIVQLCARRQHFPIDLVILLDQVVPCELFERATDILHGRCPPASAEEALNELEAFLTVARPTSLILATPFPSDKLHRPKLDAFLRSRWFDRSA